MNPTRDSPCLRVFGRVTWEEVLTLVSRSVDEIASVELRERDAIVLEGVAATIRAAIHSRGGETR